MATSKKKSTWTALKAWPISRKMRHYFSNLPFTASYRLQGSMYYKKATSILKDLEDTGGALDSYLVYRDTEKGKVYFGLYVDDNLLIEDPPVI